MAIRKRAYHLWIEDVAQLIFGSAILSVPVAYTEETWRIGASLHPFNILLILMFSVLLIGVAVYHSGYHMKNETIPVHFYLLRVLMSYMIVFITVALFLTLISKAPWMTEPMLAVKRSIIIALPASISGAAADMVK